MATKVLPGYNEWSVCTILFLYRAHPQFPLVVAANRDEFHDRPSAGPRLLGGPTRAVAGIDLRAGGTWLGVNDHGIVVGLTNQRTWHAADPGARSRGEVVRRALEARTPAQIVEQLSELDTADYNAFNLLFGNAEALHAAYARPESAGVEIAAAPEGVHVLPNDRIGARGFPKAERARRLAEFIAHAPWPELRSGLAVILGDHERPALDDIPVPPPGAAFDRERVWQNEQICTHGDSYGTRSASILALRDAGVAHYLFADGPPCRTDFEEYIHLLAGAT